MEVSYLKLNAKKRMVKNYLRCFCVSFLPTTTIFSLSLLNYYLFLLLRKTDFNKLLNSHYADYVCPVLLFISIILSLFVVSAVCLCRENFFREKSLKRNVKFFKSTGILSFRKYLVFFTVSIIRFFLAVSWCVVYLTPSLVVSGLLIYCYRYENYGYNVNLTLFVSAVILFVIGASFMYVSLKRYTACTHVLLRKNENNPLKIIAESIALMEGKSVKYSAYRLSFAGWVMSCLLIIPSAYAVPYMNMGKWCFLNSLTGEAEKAENCDKPIIFYITPKAKKVGN